MAKAKSNKKKKWRPGRRLVWVVWIDSSVSALGYIENAKERIGMQVLATEGYLAWKDKHSVGVAAQYDAIGKRYRTIVEIPRVAVAAMRIRKAPKIRKHLPK
jgi:hypothetical protein